MGFQSCSLHFCSDERNKYPEKEIRAENRAVPWSGAHAETDKGEEGARCDLQVRRKVLQTGGIVSGKWKVRVLLSTRRRATDSPFMASSFQPGQCHHKCVHPVGAVVGRRGGHPRLVRRRVDGSAPCLVSPWKTGLGEVRQSLNGPFKQ